MKIEETLKWYLEAGVDEAVDAAPVNRLAKKNPPSPSVVSVAAKPAAITAIHTEPPVVPSAAIAQARQLADAATTLDELRKAIQEFNGCTLKKTATNTVFADGNPKAQVMVIGEAPGAQEDEQGIPFCGQSGQLLDKVFKSIGLDRTTFYITNTVFWRPPGNRQPSKEELAICQPFLQKHIALVSPRLLILAGSTAASGVLQSNLAMSRLRGKTHSYSNPYLEKPIPVFVIFHPSYLLRSPGQKRLAWHDMLAIQDYLDTH